MPGHGAADATAAIGGVPVVPGTLRRKRRGERGRDVKQRASRGESKAKKEREEVLMDRKQTTLFGFGVPAHIAQRRHAQDLLQQRQYADTAKASGNASASGGNTTATQVQIQTPAVAEAKDEANDEEGGVGNGAAENSDAPPPRLKKVAKVNPVMMEKVTKILDSYHTRKPVEWQLHPPYPLRHNQALATAPFYEK